MLFTQQFAYEYKNGSYLVKDTHFSSMVGNSHGGDVRNINTSTWMIRQHPSVEAFKAYMKRLVPKQLTSILHVSHFLFSKINEQT